MTRCVVTTAGGGKDHANALNRARVAANISQRIAARHVGIAPQLLNAAEHDLATLPPEMIDKLTAFYAQVIADELKVEKCPSCGNMVRAHRQCRCMRGNWESVK